MGNETIALIVGALVGALIVCVGIAIFNKGKKKDGDMKVTKVDKLSTKELKNIVTRKMR